MTEHLFEVWYPNGDIGPEVAGLHKDALPDADELFAAFTSNTSVGIIDERGEQHTFTITGGWRDSTDTRPYLYEGWVGDTPYFLLVDPHGGQHQRGLYLFFTDSLTVTDEGPNDLIH